MYICTYVFAWTQSIPQLVQLRNSSFADIFSNSILLLNIRLLITYFENLFLIHIYIFYLINSHMSNTATETDVMML
jgi:hypothetical protein